MKDDLRFLRKKMKRPIVGWHDPNFGVRFNDYLDAIEDAVPPGSVEFITESTRSLVSEKNVNRLVKNGFEAILPSIKSWYDIGDKSRTGRQQGLAIVERVAKQVNMILSHIPYLQANFVSGLDCDEGSEPFELTQRYLILAPGTFPAYSMLSACGISAPLNLKYQRQDRVIPFPSQFLNDKGAMNVQHMNFEWPEFHRHMIHHHVHSFSKGIIIRRWKANRGWIPNTMNVLRATTF